MPNWTSNTVTISGGKFSVRKVRKILKGESDFDFNQLIPMAETLGIECGSRTDLGLACFDQSLFEKVRSYPWFVAEYPNVEAPKQLLDTLKETRPETVELGRQAAANVRDYGVPTWYEWRNEHWGTKWNACEVKLEAHGAGLTYRFDTAWSAPYPIAWQLHAICTELLGLSIEWTAEDEDVLEAYDVLQ
ncbi:hypothetical protein [Streptomyces sp. cg40]|uniref:hypothetical protein n=1 Tax=Streptomyces sp. cg40 TaxID=3419764 RepID=UPI003D045521